MQCVFLFNTHYMSASNKAINNRHIFQVYFYAHRVFLFLLTVLRIDTNVHAYACFHVHERTITQTLKDFISDLKHTLRNSRHWASQILWCCVPKFVTLQNVMQHVCVALSVLPESFSGHQCKLFSLSYQPLQFEAHRGLQLPSNVKAHLQVLCLTFVYLCIVLFLYDVQQTTNN